MQQRGRKSAASLSIVAGTIDGRPNPPESLSDDEAEVWRRVVASEGKDTFKTAALQEMLEGYCAHIIEARNLTEQLRSAPEIETAADVRVRKDLLSMREKEMRAAVSIATKLRITNQSRYQPSVAATAVNQASTERKLWERRA